MSTEYYSTTIRKRGDSDRAGIGGVFDTACVLIDSASQYHRNSNQRSFDLLLITGSVDVYLFHGASKLNSDDHRLDCISSSLN